MKLICILFSAMLLWRFGLSDHLQAQTPTANLQFVEMTNNGTYLDVKVQIKSTGADFDLYDANLYFNYSGNITGATLLSTYNFSGSGYLPMTLSTNSGNVLALNITHNAGPYTTVSSSWLDVATVRWSVTNGTGTYSLNWNTMFTHVFQWLVGVSYPVTNGTLSNLSNGLLPVQLESFVAELTARQVSLVWTTTTEMNLNGFEVQRSSDVMEWIGIGYITGHGTCNTKNSYHFEDFSEELAPPQFYRLKIIDRDGQFKYSATLKVGKPMSAGSPELLKSFPNPFAISATIHFVLKDTRLVSVTIFDETGREVVTLFENQLLGAGYYARSFVPGILASRRFFVRIVAGDYSEVQALLFNK